jgi:type II protein arginine methyltransferase
MASYPTRSIIDITKAVSSSPFPAELRAGLDQSLQRHVPSWIMPMLNDRARNEVYDLSLRAATLPGCLVLEIGSGPTAILPMMAVRAGASHAWSCESDPVMAEMARRVVADNGFSERITVIPKHSRDLRIGVDLPRKMDTVVSEIVDGDLLHEGIVETIEHAHSVLLRKGGVVIPRGARIFAAAVESVALYQQRRVDRAVGFDLSLVNWLGPYGAFHEHIARFEYRELSPPAEVLSFNFCRPGTCSESRCSELLIGAEGVVHALIAWFELDLDGHYKLDSHPRRRDCHWLSHVQLLDPPRTVKPGASLRVVVYHDTRNVDLFVEQ